MQTKSVKNKPFLYLFVLTLVLALTEDLIHENQLRSKFSICIIPLCRFSQDLRILKTSLVMERQTETATIKVGGSASKISYPTLFY